MIVSNVSLSCAAFGGSWCASGDGQLTGTSTQRTLSKNGHLIVAVCLGFIGTFGFLNNLLVLVLFCRYKMLRSPINCLLLSISVSDLLVCVLGTPLSFAASTQGRWLIGHKGCVWYGFVNACLGIVSLISLAVLSYERYCTMTGTMQADTSDYRKIAAAIVFSWSYSLAWAVAPLLGWSRYGPEGPGTTCSVDWTTKTANNVSYIVCLFLFCLVLPFVVIVYCYGRVLQALRQVSHINTAVSCKREQRVLAMVIVMVMAYLLCWLPYGVTALVAAFGPARLVTPEASIVPSILAKFSTVINPVIYIFMNNQFYRCFLAMLKCAPPQRGSSVKAYSWATKTLQVVQRRTANSPHVVASAVLNTTCSLETHRQSSEGDEAAADNADNADNAATAATTDTTANGTLPSDAVPVSVKPTLCLVAHYDDRV